MSRTPDIVWPEDEKIFAMIRDGMNAPAIAAAIGCSESSTSVKLGKLGCTYTRNGNVGFWTLPSVAEPQPKSSPAPRRKAALPSEFPFIRTYRKAGRDGEEITLPLISMRVVEGGKMGSVAQ